MSELRSAMATQLGALLLSNIELTVALQEAQRQLAAAKPKRKPEPQPKKAGRK